MCIYAADQVVFEHTQQEGVLVAFWCPAFVGSHLNWPGFHLHFLSADKQHGGHVLQLQVQQGAKVYLQEVSEAEENVAQPQLNRLCLVMSEKRNQ